MKTLHFALCLAVVVFVGCCGPSGGSGVTAVSPTDWEARLAAADAIVYSDVRDEAYRSLALNAAKANRPDIAKASVERICYSDVRDQAASETAIMLADAGNYPAGVKIATLIVYSDVRDRTLKQITARP